MGYFGGKFDLFFQRLIEIWSSLPMLFVIIILSSILKPSFLLLIGIYTLVNWISMTYLMRAEFYREKSRAYVAAALSMGQSNFKVMFKHILPNILRPVLVIGTIGLALAILAESTLSFLGVGVPPTTPSLGTLIRLGNDFLFSGEWWITFFPAIFLVILAFSINLLGDWMRDTLNPKLKK